MSYFMFHTNMSLWRTAQIAVRARTVIVATRDFHFNAISSKNYDKDKKLFTPVEQVKGSADVEGSFFAKVKKMLGFKNYKYSKSRLKRSGYLLLMAMDDCVNFNELMHSFELEDTFYSYYLLVELHVWMLMCRLSSDGPDGKLVKQALCQAMWEDIETRSKQMGEAARSSARKESIAAMGSHFNAAMFNYDEGILSNDQVLAGAVWRSFYNMQEVSPLLLARTVGYIRQQMKHLDEQDSTPLVRNGVVQFCAPKFED